MAADDGAYKTRLSTKGQVVLPKELRERRGWAAGAELVIHDTPGGLLLTRAPDFQRSTIEEAFGFLHRPGQRARTIKEMNDAVTQEARRRNARGGH